MKRKTKTLIHIQNPKKTGIWSALCDPLSEETITDEWGKVTCLRCLRLMQSVLSDKYTDIVFHLF